MSESLATTFGNPSSLHTIGRKASQVLRESRETVAKALNVMPREIVFTSGASEANNTAIIGYALANRSKGNHILTTAIEHPSVLNAVKYLHERHGFDVTFVKPLANGNFPAELISQNLREDTILVSMMAANNETGQLLPVAEVGEMLQAHKAVFHVDATQIMGKIPAHPKEIGADFLSASAHKFHGPKGVGFLYHDALKFDSLIHGGEQEEKRRAGTENLHSLVGMAKALEISLENMDDNFHHVENLKKTLLTELGEQTSLSVSEQAHNGFAISKNTALDFYQNEFGKSMPHVVNLAFPGQNHDLLLTKLDMAGIAISTGSACTAGTVEPSHVLEAVYGTAAPQLKENIRVSFSELNTFDEVVKFAETLKNILMN